MTGAPYVLPPPWHAFSVASSRQSDGHGWRRLQSLAASSSRLLRWRVCLPPACFAVKLRVRPCAYFRAFRCSAPAVWNSLPKTVLSSVSVAVFKSRLYKDNTLYCLYIRHSLSPIGFLFFLCSLTRWLASAPLKLRPCAWRCANLFIIYYIINFVTSLRMSVQRAACI